MNKGQPELLAEQNQNSPLMYSFQLPEIQEIQIPNPFSYSVDEDQKDQEGSRRENHTIPLCPSRTETEKLATQFFEIVQARRQAQSARTRITPENLSKLESSFQKEELESNRGRKRGHEEESEYRLSSRAASRRYSLDELVCVSTLEALKLPIKPRIESLNSNKCNLKSKSDGRAQSDAGDRGR